MGLRTTLLCGTLLAVMPAAAGAQTVPPSDQATVQPSSIEPSEDVGDDIVVTAQRREQRLQDVPISVSVTTGEAISKQGFTSLEQVSARLPNVRLVPSAAADLLNIRGIGSGLNAGFEQSVATFVDGVYRSRARSIRSALFDVERVEVLKGPQSTFFGNNAIAGAINITTRKPGDVASYDATALYSPTDGEYILGGGVSAPVTDELAVRVAMQFSGMDGYVYNTNLREHEPHLRDWIGRASVRWEPSAAWRTDLRVDIVRQRDRGTFHNELVNCPAAPEYGGARGTCATYIGLVGAANVDDRLDYRSFEPRSFFNNDMVEFDLTNRLLLGDYSLTSTTGYFYHDLVNNINAQPFPFRGTGGTTSPLPFTAPETYRSFSQEFRLQSPLGRTIEYTLGAYYSRGKLYVANYFGYFFTTFGARAAPFYNADSPITHLLQLRQNDRTLSTFGAATWNMTPKLKLNVGLRYSAVRKSADRSVAIGTAGSVPGPDNFVAGPQAAQSLLAPVLGLQFQNFADRTRNDRRLLPSANVQYAFNPALSGYASYTKGFKAGGFGLTTIPNPFDEESVDAYEAGLKGTAFDRALTFNLAVFSSTYKGLQESSPLTQPNGTVIVLINNAATSRSRGVELGATLRVTDNLSFTGDIGYLDATYRSFTNGPCTVLQSLRTPVGCQQDLTGRTRQYAPDWSGNVGASLSLPLSRDVDLRIDPNMYFTTEYYQQGSIDPLFLQGGYAKVDLRAAVGPEDRSWEIAVIGRNLTDKVTASYRTTIGTAPGSIYALAERPRSVAIQVSIRN